MYKLTKEQMDLLYYEKSDKYDWLKFENQEDLFYVKAINQGFEDHMKYWTVVFRNGKADKFYGFDCVLMDDSWYDDYECNMYEMCEIIEKTYRRI